MLSRLVKNPITIKELRGRMRGGRAFLILTLYLSLLGGFVGLIYLTTTSSIRNTTSAYGMIIEVRRILGKTIFAATVIPQLFLVCFIAPALTSGAISSERERLTYDLLRTTLLTAPDIVLGKLVSAISYLLLLILTTLPIQSLAFLFGGVSPEEVLIACLLTVISALFFSIVGLFFSSFTKSTLSSTILSYGCALLIMIGFPILIIIIITGVGTWMSVSPPPILIEGLVLYGILLILSLNPISAAITSEIMLVNDGSLLYSSIPLTNGVHVPLISPWILFALLFLGMSVIGYGISIRFVDRPDR